MTPRDGFIYIIQQEHTNLYKIGFTQDDNIRSRLSNVQVGNPQNILLVGSFYTYNVDIEKHIHTYFKDNLIRGEWFQLTKEHVHNILDPQWREQQGFYSHNLELTIDDLFQEYFDLHSRMSTLLRKLRHVLSTYKLKGE